MNKTDLINAVAKNAALTKKDAKSAIEAMLGAIKKNSKQGVQLVGFGSFKVVKRKGRKGSKRIVRVRKKGAFSLWRATGRMG